jgi:hypothetical protein
MLRGSVAVGASLKSLRPGEPPDGEPDGGSGNEGLQGACHRLEAALIAGLAALAGAIGGWRDRNTKTGAASARASPRRGDLRVQEPALAKAGDGILPSDFFRRNVVLSFQEGAIGIRLHDVIGSDNTIWDNMMWGSDYPHSESTFPKSREDPGRGAGPRTGQDRGRQHRPRVQF